MAARRPTGARSTTAKGRAGEDRAVAHLESLGYVVVARNVRTKGGEIDVIAREGDLLCFVEVRGRDRADDALFSIDARKQRRLTRAASAYLQVLARTQPIPRCRFDVVVVTPEAVAVTRGAFEAAA